MSDITIEMEGDWTLRAKGQMLERLGGGPVGVDGDGGLVEHSDLVYLQIEEGQLLMRHADHELEPGFYCLTPQGLFRRVTPS